MQSQFKIIVSKVQFLDNHPSCFEFNLFQVTYDYSNRCPQDCLSTLPAHCPISQRSYVSRVRSSRKIFCLIDHNNTVNSRHHGHLLRAPITGTYYGHLLRAPSGPGYGVRNSESPSGIAGCENKFYLETYLQKWDYMYFHFY